MAESITIPRIIYSGCSHKKVKPDKMPKYKLDENVAPPIVMPLWSQPGPDSFIYVFRTAPSPF
jgi:hypothetical protein